MQPWINDELQTADLGDERLEARFRLLLDRFSAKPSLAVPAACRGRTEVEAAYRFFNNSAVTFDRVLRPHADATLTRAREHLVVLAVQDTTELDVTRPKQQMKDAGPLNDPDRFGFLLHPLLLFTPEALPLGVAAAQVWARDPKAFALPSKEKAAARKKKAIDDKESFRWLRGYRQACEVAAACPETQVVCLSDSEGDIFECFFEALPKPGVRKAEWIVRACEDRALVPPDPEAQPQQAEEAEEAEEQPQQAEEAEEAEAQQAEAQRQRLFAQVAATKVLTTLTLEIRERPAQSADGRKRKQARSARKATVSVQAARLTLRQPRRAGGKKMADVAVNAVLVRELDPPAGEQPVQWLLLTSLGIEDLEQVLRVVHYYCARWQIEIYFKVLKSGCQVEQSQLEEAGRFLPYLGLFLIVAWRVLHLTMLGRECPELPCECVLEPEEWQAVYAVVKQQEPPAEPPPLGEMVKLIASLGGYLDRSGDGPPGPKAMWVGIQRMHDLALGWRARGAQAKGQAPPRPRTKKAPPDSTAHPPPPSKPP